MLALLGHRSPTDYELSAPRYGEDPAALHRAATQLAAIGPAHGDGFDDASDLPAQLQPLILRARRFVTLKEDAKHESLREAAQLRRLILAFDHRFKLRGTVWFLTLDEMATLAPETVSPLFRLACERLAHFEAVKSIALPGTTLTLRQIELGPLMFTQRRTVRSGVLTGTRVSGSAAAEGRALCVDRSTAETGAPIPGFEPGDIIVARALHPAWLPELMNAGGVAVEIGGFLSHMAILARERGVAMSVGVQGIENLRTGMRIRLDPDGAVVCL